MKNKLAILILCFFSLIPITWFRGNDLIAAGDNYFFLNLPRYLKTVSEGWRPNNNTGNLEYNLEFHLPFSLFFLPADFFNIPYNLAEKLWFVLALFLPGFFMYKFLDRFMADNVGNLFKLLGALFYMFNPFCMLQPLGIVLTKFPVYLALPLVGYLILWLFEQGGDIKKLRGSALLAFASLSLGGSFRNVAEVAPFIIVEVCILIYALLHFPERIKNCLYVLLAFVLALLVNFWWIGSSFLNQYASRFTFANSIAGFDAGASLMFDSLRLMGFWALPSYFKNVLYYPFGVYYYSFLEVVGTYFITAIVFYPLLYISMRKTTKQQKVLTLTVSFLVLLGIFFVKGRTPPLGVWYNALRHISPLFSIFRETFSKFSLISVFAFSAGVSLGLFFVGKTIGAFTRKSNFLVLVLFIPLLVYVSFPMFNGQIVAGYTYGPIKQMTVNVPYYWEELYRYTSEHKPAGRTLTLPKNGYYNKSYIWKQGYSGNPFEFYFNGNTLSYIDTDPKTLGDYVVNELYESIEQYNASADESYMRSTRNLLRLLGVSNLLQMNDYDWRASTDYANWSVSNMAGFYDTLSEKRIVTVKKDFGFLTRNYLLSIPHIKGGSNIYRFDGDPSTQDYLNDLTGKPGVSLYTVKEDIALAKIYSPDLIVPISDDQDFYAKLKQFDYTNQRPLFIQNNIADTRVVVVDPPKVEFSQESPTRFKVVLSGNIQTNFYLVLNETYDAGWTLLDAPGGSELLEHHFVGNMFANVWEIRNGSLGENTTIYIEHESGKRLAITSAISIVAFGIIVLLLVGGYVKKYISTKVS